jgi:hypothetical protein
LIKYRETGTSNFFFKECKELMEDGLMRFLVRSSAGIQFIPKENKIFYIKVMDFTNVVE